MVLRQITGTGIVRPTQTCHPFSRKSPFNRCRINVIIYRSRKGPKTLSVPTFEVVEGHLGLNVIQKTVRGKDKFRCKTGCSLPLKRSEFVIIRSSS